MTQKEKYIEVGLTHGDPCIRADFASKKDHKHTKQQIERGLTDTSWLVRIEFARRYYYELDSDQRFSGLNDCDNEVAGFFKEKQREMDFFNEMRIQYRKSCEIKKPGEVNPNWFTPEQLKWIFESFENINTESIYKVTT